MTRARTPSPSRIAILLLATALAMASPAAAVERTAEEVDGLARSAPFDASADDELRKTTSIDGVPVDMEWILGDPEVTADRLGAFVVDRSTRPSDAGERARAILTQDRFDTSGGIPASAVLQAWALRTVSGILLAIEQAIPGGLTTVGWVLLVLAVAGIATASWSLLRRRELAIESAERTRGRRRGPSAAALDARALEAAREGRFDEALRLHFVAALIRLDSHGAIRLHDGLTSGSVTATLSHPLASRLVAVHDEVVYGDRPATPADAEQSRTGWRQVVQDVTP